MKPIAWDTETELLGPGYMAPRIACLSYASPSKPVGLVHWTEAEALFKLMLSSDRVLVGHNVAYDMGVMMFNFPSLREAIFKAYDENRVTDTMLRQKLIDISQGCYRGKLDKNNVWMPLKYSLLDLTRRYTGRVLEKDEWRLRYADLRHLPLSEWPEGAKTYAIEDAKSTLEVYSHQTQWEDVLEDQFRQARAAFWLHLASARGLRTNGDAVERLKSNTEQALKVVQARLVEAKLVREDGSRDTKAAAAHMEQICKREGLPLRQTEKGNISLDSEACVATEDPTLEDYAELTSLAGVLNKDVKALASGVDHPVHTRFDMAETGRTTSSGPNVQNWRRLPGIRECFVPRGGFVFAQADYEGLELRTLAQSCIKLVGASTLGVALNRGEDPHLRMASTILGITYEEAAQNKKRPDVDAARQTAKVANFGFPGGLGVDKFIAFAKKGYNVTLTEEQAKHLKQQWLSSWPEMREYFDHIRKLTQNPDKLAKFQHLFSKRWRGGATYTAACNSYFQGLGADATKHAGWLVAKACYVDKTSPLYGSYVVNFVHDEFIVEVPEAQGHEAACELERLMCLGANEWLVDVPTKAPPLLMRCWSKEAVAVYGPDGKLIPWEGKRVK